MKNKTFLILAFVVLSVVFGAKYTLSQTTTSPVFTNVRVENIMQSGAQVKWTTDVLTDSRVGYGTTSGNYIYDSNASCDSGGYVLQHCVNLMGLDSSANYYYRVKSFDQNNVGGPSSEYTFISDSSGMGDTSGNFPTEPSNLTATVMSSGYDINLTWSDNSSDEDGFGIYYKNLTDTYWNYWGTTGVDITSYNLIGLPIGTLDFMAQACNLNGCSVASNIATVTIGGVGTTIPNAPSNLSAVASSNGVDVQLTWSDNSTDENSFKVKYRTQSDTNFYYWGMTSSADITSYNVTGLPIGTLDFVVQACNLNGCSVDSNTATVMTGGSTTTPPPTTTNATVTGIITDNSGVSVSGAFIDVYTENYFTSWNAQSDSSGTYTVYGIPAGTYFMSVYPPYDQPNLISPSTATITLSENQVLSQNFSFVAAAKIVRGRVMYANGSGITDANVGAFQNDSNSWAETSTDSNGNYILNVSGGSWELNLWSNSPNPDWNYSQEQQIITFSDNTSIEEIVLDFTVTSTDSRVRGKVARPDGGVPSPNSTWVSFRSSSGFEYGGSIDSSGSFDVPIPSGTYTINVFTEDKSLTVADLTAITINPGETKDIGIIQLILKNEHIEGSVLNSSGVGVGGVEVSAWNVEGFGYTNTQTNSSGSYDLFVSPGAWEVAVYQDPTKDLYNPEPPKRVDINIGDTVILNFTLLSSDASISGRILDAQGNLLSNLYGWAELREDASFNEFSSGIGGSIDRGTFKFSAPAGTYQLFVYFPPDSNNTPPAPKQVTLVSGQELRVDLKALNNTSVIKGVLKDESGNVVTGLDARVFASSSSGVWQEAIVNRATGGYTLNVSAGTWYVGYDVFDDSGYVTKDHNTKITILEGQTITQDFVLLQADSYITGNITDPLGKGVFGVFVGVSETNLKDVAQGDVFIDPIIAEAVTDANGFYRIAVPAGTYFVKTFVNLELGYLSAKQEEVTITKGQTLTLNLSLRTATLKITGKALANGVPLDDVFVWAWSEFGGFQKSFTKIDGSYQVSVISNETWVVAASGVVNGEFYKSNEIFVKVGTENIIQNIDLQKVGAIASAETQTVTATQSTAITTSDGATVVAPANSISTSGSVTLTISPDTRIISQGEIKVVGIAYDLEARDEAGQIVTSFNNDVTVTLPYAEEDVANLGTTESNLSMSFWDETVGTWKSLDNSIVNTDQNTVTATTLHFTRFAIVSAADITPPSAPADITAQETSPGTITLSWVNPTSDFRHIKIYRSTTEGELGEVVFNDITATSQTDTDVTKNTTYYYTVRALDPAGNESQNTDQVSATPSATGSGLVDGDLVTTEDSFDIYIIKLIGNKKFKRLILNPQIFESYGHLQWENVKKISQTTQDLFTLSDLVIEVYPDGSVADPKVYKVSSAPNSDVGQKQWLNMSAETFEALGNDWDAIANINQTEASPEFYPEGIAITG